MRFLSALGLIGLVAVIGGCVAIESSSINDRGIVYFLPKSILTITVVQYKDIANGRTWYQVGGNPKKKDNTASELDLSVLEVQCDPIPDVDHRYVALYQPSATSDDRFCVARSTEGLLQELDFASDDRTPAIAVNIARAIKAALPSPTGVTGLGISSDNVQVRSYTGRIDPTRRQDRIVFNRALLEIFGEHLEIDFSRMKEIFDTHTAALPTSCSRDGECDAQAFTDRCTADSICYRTAIKVPIDLKRNGQTVDVNYASVINPKDVGAISIRRAFLVHKISKFYFDQGILTGAMIRKPSEVEAASLLPLQVIYAVLATPSAAVSNAFSSSNNSAFVSEVSNLNSNVAKLADSQKQLQASLTGTGPSFGTAETYSMNCTATGSYGLVSVLSGSSYKP
jgi:hypothetical protein